MTFTVKGTYYERAADARGIVTDLWLLDQQSNGQLDYLDAQTGALVPIGPNPGTTWDSRGWGDFNGDLCPDAVFQDKTTGQIAVWDLNGSSLVGGGLLNVNAGTSWGLVQSAGADFNGDGLSDLLLQNPYTGQVAVWEVKGTQVVGGGTVSPTPGAGWHAAGTMDDNHDGKTDVLFQNTASGQVAVWDMNGSTIVGGGSIGPAPGAGWRLVGPGQDSRVLYFQNYSTGDVVQWDLASNGLGVTAGHDLGSTAATLLMGGGASDQSLIYQYLPAGQVGVSQPAGSATAVGYPTHVTGSFFA